MERYLKQVIIIPNENDLVIPDGIYEERYTYNHTFIYNYTFNSNYLNNYN